MDEGGLIKERLELAPELAGALLFDLEVPAEPRFLGILRLTLAAVCQRHGLDPEQTENLKLAVTEACTRCLQSGSPPRALRLRGARRSKSLALCVSLDPPLPPAELDREPWRMGLYLMGACAGRVELLEGGRGFLLLSPLPSP